jgi:hypothetical protein
MSRLLKEAAALASIVGFMALVFTVAALVTGGAS